MRYACLLALAAFLLPAQAPAQDGAAIYKERCASCHDVPAGRVPEMSALKAMSGDHGLFGSYPTAINIDVDKEALHASDPLVEPASTNLSTFSQSGGKLIFFHGDSDPWFSPLDTLGYHKSLAAANGGEEEVSNGAKCSLCPGCVTAVEGRHSTSSTCSEQ